MKVLSEKRALEKLHEIKVRFTMHVRQEYEHRAKSCAACETPGACCLDAHFVNVRITRLEATAIRHVIEELPNRDAVMSRVESVVERLGGSEFYACPLFEKNVGCLVHERGKPLPCIAHACYENEKDLPPDELITQHEGLVENLNEVVYRKPVMLSPLPVAIARHRQPVSISSSPDALPE